VQAGKLSAVSRLRALAGLAAAAAAIGGLSGCGHIDAALSKQAAVVVFRPHTSRATLLTVRQACSQVPHARPLRISARAAKVSVRFATSTASVHDLAELRSCLRRFPEVTGLTFDDTAHKAY
jgi:hypothetical protein